MRKTLLMLAATLLFAFPAFAQHGHNGGGRMGGHEGHGEIRRQDTRPIGRAPARGEAHGEGNFHDNHGFRGYHYGVGRHEVRSHWREGRFDHDFFVAHWGYAHPFFWGHCQWFGPRFYPGSYFWFDGVDFVIIEAVPDYWYDDEVYVDYIDGYGYALVNPMYPGVHYRIDIRF